MRRNKVDTSFGLQETARSFVVLFVPFRPDSNFRYPYTSLMRVGTACHGPNLVALADEERSKHVRAPCHYYCLIIR